MSKFTLLRGNCPICSGHRDDCRQSDSTGLIFCRHDDVNPPGYVNQGIDAHGFNIWASVESINIFTNQGVEERQRKQREYLELQAQQRQQQKEQQLSAFGRDKDYRRSFNQLPLNNHHRDNLLKRGLTLEQIEEDGYKSVKPWQKINGAFPVNLPGLLPNGCLNVPAEGIICPVYDQEGLIVACQVRLDEPGLGGQRYIWLTSSTKKNTNGATPHLNNELPLTVCEPENYQGDTIWLAEGSIKSSLARYKLNAPVLGAMGGNFASSPETAKAEINYLSAKYQTKLLTLAVDAGDILNSVVLKRLDKQIKFFSELGYKCQIAWWGQITKNDCDIDELDDLTQIKFISVDDFRTLNENHKITTSNTKQELQAEKDNDYEKCKAIRDELTNITEQDIKIVNVSHMEEVLSSLVQHKAANIIISDTGTGKTEALQPIVDQADAVHDYHNRISLAKANAKKLGFVYKDEALDSNYANKKKVSFCTPSCINFNPRDLRKNGIALIDEADQVFNFNFEPLANKDGIRPSILSTMEAAIKSSVYDGMAICMSADMTQKEIDYIKPMLPPGTPLNIIVNQFQPVKPTINFDISSSPEEQLKTLMSKLADGIPCFVMDDMKNGIKGGKTIAEYVRFNMPQLSELILEINADVTGDPKVTAFFDSPDEESEKYLLIICSPSVVGGLSLKNQRFIHGIFAFCNGILMDRGIKQFINRVRGGKDIYLWVVEKGFPPKEIPSNLLEVEEIGEYYKTNHQFNSKHILSFKAEYEPMTDEFTSHHFELNIKNLAYKAATSRHLRQFTREHLELVGYPIKEVNTTIPKEEIKQIRSDLIACWNGIEIKEALEIDNARFLTDSEMEAIELGGKEVTAELRPAYLKTRMRRDFGEKLIEATEYEHKKTKQIFTGYAAMALKNAGNRFKRQLDNFYLLSQSVDESAARDYATEFRQLKHGEGRFAGDITWNARARKCREWLGMPELLNIQEWIEPEDYISIIERAKLHPEQLRSVLNLTTDKKTNGQILGELFDQIGLKFETKKIEGRKIKLRRISADSLNYANMYVEYRLSLKTAIEEVAEAEPVAEVVKVEEITEVAEIQPETAIAVQHQQLNLLDPIQPGEISQVNQFGSSPPIDDPIFGHVELIREFMADASWGLIQIHFAKLDEVSEKRVLQQLTTEERTMLNSLKPLDEEEVKAKELIDIINSGKDIQSRCDRALEGVENRQNLVHYLHRNYHYLLFPQNKAA